MTARLLDEALAALRGLRDQRLIRGDAETLKALERLAAGVDALALERAAQQARIVALEVQAERERNNAMTLARAAQMINSSLELEEVLRRVLDLAVEVMQAERGYLVLRGEAEATFEVAVLHNLERPELESSQTLRISKSIVDRVLSTGVPVITTDAQCDPRFNAQQSIVALQIRSIVCAPLKLRDRIIGAVYLDSRVIPGLFSRRDPDLLVAFGNQAAFAIENARLYAEARVRLAEISNLEAFRTRILDATANGVITIDAERRITTFNAAAGATFGADAETFVGRPVEALASLLPEIEILLDRYVGEERAIGRYEVSGTHASHRSLSLELRIAALDEGDGAERGFAIVINDLTARRALEHAHEKQLKRSREIEASFSRYLAPHVVQSLIRDPSAVELGGERQLATILFADIRGFTAMSTKMRPEAVVELLNTYLEEAVSAVFAHSGLLDKFYGDGIMAVYGPPRVRPDDAARAIGTALRLHYAVRALRSRLSHPLQVSVGIATGVVVAGNIGCSRRLEYTVIGDAVNLASRLQSAAPPDAIYCDRATYEASHLAHPAEVLDARIRGRDDVVQIYSLKF